MNLLSSLATLIRKTEFSYSGIVSLPNCIASKKVVIPQIAAIAGNTGNGVHVSYIIIGLIIVVIILVIATVVSNHK